MKRKKRDFYSILGVGPEATQEQLHAAFIARARIVHPDRFDKKMQPEDWRKANEMQAELNSAYSILKDARRREEYDRSWGEGGRPARLSRRVVVYGLAIGLAGAGLLAALAVNGKEHGGEWVRQAVPAIHAARERGERPEKDLPENGSVKRYTDANGVAPLELTAAEGGHYVVKLIDAFNGRPVLSVFVRNGMSVKVKVPLGIYEVHYACGTRWYGDEYLFGPGTQYSKTERIFEFKMAGDKISGFTITLRKVGGK